MGKIDMTQSQSFSRCRLTFVSLTTYAHSKYAKAH